MRPEAGQYAMAAALAPDQRQERAIRGKKSGLCQCQRGSMLYSNPTSPCTINCSSGSARSKKTVKQIANRAQITVPVTSHVLRHTFATLALQKGSSLAAVQKMLGHNCLATTEIYLNLTESHVLEEYQNK